MPWGSFRLRSLRSSTGVKLFLTGFMVACSLTERLEGVNHREHRGPPETACHSAGLARSYGCRVCSFFFHSSISSCLYGPTHMQLAAELQAIDGARELHDWFGYWPSFHDAEIIRLHLNRRGSSSLVIHTWEMTKEVDEKGLLHADQACRGGVHSGGHL